MKITTKKIEQLARALFPRYGIKDVTSLVATITKYRNNDGHVKIWRPEGGWSWFASPGTTVATSSMVTLKFPADYRRTAAQARDDLYRQLEDATLGVMSEDEMEAAVARGGSPLVPNHATKQSNARRNAMGDVLTDDDFRQAAKFEMKRYGLTLPEATTLVKDKRYPGIVKTIEDWRGRHGWPAANSPLSRGYVYELLGLRLGRGR